MKINESRIRNSVTCPSYVPAYVPAFVTTKMVEGRPADRIIDITNKANIDFIVIGSRGLGGVKQIVLGSVSDRVADEAPCPVLIVK